MGHLVGLVATIDASLGSAEAASLAKAVLHGVAVRDPSELERGHSAQGRAEHDDRQTPGRPEHGTGSEREETVAGSGSRLSKANTTANPNARNRTAASERGLPDSVRSVDTDTDTDTDAFGVAGVVAVHLRL